VLTFGSVSRAWLVALVAVLSSCGEDRIDADKAAVAIKSGLAAHDLTLAALTCPSRPYRAGDTFACTGATAEQQPVTVNVTQRDGSGNLEWALDGMELHASKIRSEILPKLGSGFDLSCPHEVSVVKIGDWTRCTIKKDGQTAHLDVKVDDVQGNESYKVEQ
jgi:hypothetical protein